MEISAIFGYLRKSSEISGEVPANMFGNVRVALGQLWENLRKSLESGDNYFRSQNMKQGKKYGQT